MNTEPTEQEAEAKAKQIRSRMPPGPSWEAMSREEQKGWVTLGRITLREIRSDTKRFREQCAYWENRAKEAETVRGEADATLNAFRQELAMWKERAGKAEKALASEVATISKELEFAQALAESLRQERDLAREALVDGAAKVESRAAKAEAQLAKYHDVAKHRDEVMERLTNERNEAVVKAHTLEMRAEKAEKELESWVPASPKPEGIEGTLIQAGTLTDGAEVFSGMVLSVPWEALRDAKRMPLYGKVRVVEVLG